MKIRATEECACIFCGGRDGVEVIAREDGAASKAAIAALAAAVAMPEEEVREVFS